MKKYDQMNKIREAKRLLFTKDATKKAVEISERLGTRNSGFLRTTALGVREGDASKVVLIEFVDNAK